MRKELASVALVMDPDGRLEDGLDHEVLLPRSWGREAENQPGAVILGDMNAREEVFAWLKERGVSYVFGNPGSTEIPFLGGLEAMS